MRHATVRLTWTDGVHPIDDRFADVDDVYVDAIRYVSPVHEGRYVELFDVRGNLERARSLLADAPEVLEYDVAGADGRGVVYVQCRTAGLLVDDLLAILREHEIVPDWPMRSLEGDVRGVEVGVFGTSRAIQRAAAALPDGVDLDLERLAEYDPDPDGRSRLTERQRELFDLAVSEGYYEVPRRTTHRELAAQLDVAPATVSEGLQRVEAKLVEAYAGSTVRGVRRAARRGSAETDR